jgi:hypothetical protein
MAGCNALPHAAPARPVPARPRARPNGPAAPARLNPAAKLAPTAQPQLSPASARAAVTPIRPRDRAAAMPIPRPANPAATAAA